MSTIIYYMIRAINLSYIVLQALQSDRRVGNTHLQIPAASYYVFTLLTIAISLPLYDRVLVPLLHCKKSRITLLQRIGIGMALSVVAMFVSAVVEQKRRKLPILTESTGGKGSSRSSAFSLLSGMWLLPQEIIAGLSEAFAVIGLAEFYYKEMPDNMRTIGIAFLYSGIANIELLNQSLGFCGSYGNISQQRSSKLALRRLEPWEAGLLLLPDCNFGA